MLLNTLAKAIGFENLFAGQALRLASRALVVVSALVVVPAATHADCLPSVPNGWQIPFYMSTHDVTTHAVEYATGTLIDSTHLLPLLSGDNFPQLFSDRFVACGPDCLVPTQPFDVGQADHVGLAITRTLAFPPKPSTISITLTLDTWGHTKYTFVGACDASTNLLYGSFTNNTMAVISFGTPVPTPPIQ